MLVRSLDPPCPFTKVTWYSAVKTHMTLVDHRPDSAGSDLDRKIAEFIKHPTGGDAAFEQLALELFEYQYGSNEAYLNLCNQQGRTPANVSAWRDIPAVAAASFSDARIACFPELRTRIRFVSSGTTRTGAAASVHELEDTGLYEVSLTKHFRRCVLPDRARIPMIILSPPFEDAPNSSLAYMLSKLFVTFGSGGGFYIRNGSLDTLGVLSSLQSFHEPVLVFGTAFAMIHFLDTCVESRRRFTLAPGSRIIDTGGFKGRSRSLEPGAFYELVTRAFGVSRPYCVSEYGMCELGSQWYDANLMDTLDGKSPRYGLKVGPPWTRIQVVDPVSGQSIAPGSIGLLQVHDLSNRGSVAAVLTGDLVNEKDGGFAYIGRSHAAPPKGCSITIDTMLGTRG